MRENSKGASELARRLAELEKTGFSGIFARRAARLLHTEWHR